MKSLFRLRVVDDAHCAARASRILAIVMIAYWTCGTARRVQAQPAGQVATEATVGEVDALAAFFDLLSDNDSVRQAAKLQVAEDWTDGAAMMVLELQRFAQSQQLRDELLSLVQEKTLATASTGREELMRRIWNADYEPHPNYAEFKKRLYARVDNRFDEYFSEDRAATIRLDEIRWGGVVRDGIPPLNKPHTLAATEANYLGDGDVVFGIVVDGQARAYPKRILAWHEMVKDVLGGRSINGVYCTLCGSMIVYFTEDASGRHHELGTSGFLYRSNKLMYDQATKSLWSTLAGEPVVGPLVGQSIKLATHPVVTTTWGKWSQLHPQTTVLSLKTGHRRDYREGIAYRRYFSTHQLMFGVPKRDERLKNKDEVFVIRTDENEDSSLVFSQDFLSQTPVVQRDLAGKSYVVVTDETGANRAFSAADKRFVSLADGRLEDSAGQAWIVSETELLNEKTKERLPRVAGHRAFWFGWYAAHPNVDLIQN